MSNPTTRREWHLRSAHDTLRATDDKLCCMYVARNRANFNVCGMRIGRLRVCKERGDVRRRRQTGKWKGKAGNCGKVSAVAACSCRRHHAQSEPPERRPLMLSDVSSHACKRPSVYCTQYVNQYVEGNGGCPGRSFRIVSNLNPVTDRNDRQRRQTPRSNRSETDSRQRRASHQADRPPALCRYPSPHGFVHRVVGAEWQPRGAQRCRRETRNSSWATMARPPRSGGRGKGGNKVMVKRRRRWRQRWPRPW